MFFFNFRRIINLAFVSYVFMHIHLNKYIINHYFKNNFHIHHKIHQDNNSYSIKK